MFFDIKVVGWDRVEIPENKRQEMVEGVANGTIKDLTDVYKLGIGVRPLGIIEGGELQQMEVIENCGEPTVIVRNTFGDMLATNTMKSGVKHLEFNVLQDVYALYYSFKDYYTNVKRLLHKDCWEIANERKTLNRKLMEIDGVSSAEYSHKTGNNMMLTIEKDNYNMGTFKKIHSIIYEYLVENAEIIKEDKSFRIIRGLKNK